MFIFTNEIRYAPKYNENPRVKDVYVMSPDGTRLKQVSEFGNHPLWHPNGQQILSNSPYEGWPANALVLSDADTGERTVAAIEGNARQYCPGANREWAKRYPPMFNITDGSVGSGMLNGIGLGF